MRLTPRVMALAVLAASGAGPALAQVPNMVTFNGRLTNAQGAAVSGTHSILAELYGAPTGGSALWSESYASASFSSDGLVFLNLGSTTALTPAVFSGGPLYLQLSVDGAAMSPRVSLVSVPYAIRAGAADVATRLGSLAESDVQRRVTGTCGVGMMMTGVAADGTVGCAPAGTVAASTTSGLTTSAGASNSVNVSLMTCSAGQILKSGGGTWACGGETAYSATAGGGLTVSSGNAFSLMPCATGQALVSSGLAWSCGTPGTVSSVSASMPLVVTNPTTTPSISLPAANGTTNGYLSAADWTAFNAKGPRGRNLVDWVPDISKWTHLPGNSYYSMPQVTLDTAAGNVIEGDSSFRFAAGTGATSNGSWSTYGGLIPLDPALPLHGRIQIKAAAGTGTFYFGVIPYDVNKAALTTITSFPAIANVASPTTWTAFEDVLQGEGTNPQNLPAGTRFIRPFIITNFTGPSSGVTSVDGLQLWQETRRVFVQVLDTSAPCPGLVTGALVNPAPLLSQAFTLSHAAWVRIEGKEVMIPTAAGPGRLDLQIQAVGATTFTTWDSATTYSPTPSAKSTATVQTVMYLQAGTSTAQLVGGASPGGPGFTEWGCKGWGYLTITELPDN